MQFKAASLQSYRGTERESCAINSLQTWLNQFFPRIQLAREEFPLLNTVESRKRYDGGSSRKIMIFPNHFPQQHWQRSKFIQSFLTTSISFASNLDGIRPMQFILLQFVVVYIFANLSLFHPTKFTFRVRK